MQPNLKSVPLKSLLAELSRRSLSARASPAAIRVSFRLPIRSHITELSVLDLDTGENDHVRFVEGVDPKL